MCRASSFGTASSSSSLWPNCVCVFRWFPGFILIGIFFSQNEPVSIISSCIILCLPLCQNHAKSQALLHSRFCTGVVAGYATCATQAILLGDPKQTPMPCSARFAGLTERFGREIEAVKTQYPFEDMKVHCAVIWCGYQLLLSFYIKLHLVPHPGNNGLLFCFSLWP